MSDIRLKKAYEVALVCAAQDGLDFGEVKMVADSIMSVPLLTGITQQFFEEEDEIDLMETIGVLPELMEMMDEFEITTMDDDYMAEASEVLGESPALQNVCLAMSILFSAGDGEVSGAESEAIGVVMNNLPFADFEMAQTLTQKIVEMSQAMLDEDE